MRVGIIVYSETGNTYMLAMKIKDKLLASGHLTELKRLETIGEYKSGAKEVQLESIPEVDEYDWVMFGSPVHGFTLSLPMRTFLSQIGSLENKKVACFATQFLLFSWMGGKNTISEMKKICESKGGQVLGTGVVNWTRKDRQELLSRISEKLSKCVC